MAVNGAKIGVMVVVVIALVFQIVSLATPSWLVFKTTFSGIPVESKTGLWKTCSTATAQGRTNTVCVDLTNADNTDLKAARGLMIVSILMVLGSLGGLGASIKGQGPQVLMTVLGILFVQAALQAGGTGAGMKALEKLKDTFSASYDFSMALGWVSAGLYFCAAFITGIIRSQTE